MPKNMRQKGLVADISLNQFTYERLRDYCRDVGIPIRFVAEVLIYQAMIQHSIEALNDA